jgi:hypothetical protein
MRPKFEQLSEIIAGVTGAAASEVKARLSFDTLYHVVIAIPGH